MRITSGEQLINLASKDSVYPSKSPTCDPPLVGCGQPQPVCVAYQYAWKRDGRDFCRAPSMFDPTSLTSLDCPYKQFDAKHPGDKGTMKHASNHKTGTSSIPKQVQALPEYWANKKQKRQVRERERVRQWAVTWLSAHLDRAAARNVFYDSEESVTLSDYQTLCDDIYKDWCQR